MRKTHKWQNSYRIISLSIGALISLFGLVSLIFWHLGKSSSLIIPPSTFPISYMVCVAFLISGIALFLLYLQRKTYGANIIGFVMLFVSILKISEIVFHVNTGLQKIFFEWFWDESIQSSFIAFLGSISFSLIGIVFLIWKIRPRSIFLSNITTLIAIIIFFIGLVETFSYVLPINYSFYFHEIKPMNFYTAVGLSLLSIAIMATNRYFDEEENLQVNNWMPFYVGFSLFCFSVFVILGVHSQKRKIIHELMVNQAFFFETEIKDDLRENAIFLKRMAQTIRILKDKPSQNWEEEVKSYITDLPEIHAVFWLDKDFNIKSQYQIPEKKKDINLQKIILKLKSNLSLLLEKKAYFLIDTQSKYFFLVNPIFENDEYAGSIMEVILVENFFNKVIDKVKNNYIFSVYANNVLIFGNEHREDAAYKKWGESKTIQIENEKLTIDFFPTDQMIQLRYNDIIIPMMFLASFLLSTISAFLVYFLQIANKRLLLVDDARQKMRKASDERDSALEAAQVGLISYDIKHQMVNFDPRSAYLFGYDSDVSRIEFKKFLSRFPEEHRNKLINDIQDMRKQEEVFDYEFLHVQWADQSTHDIRARGKVFRDENNLPLMISGVVWDVSVIKRTQMLLQLSESIAKLLSESIPLDQAASRMVHLFHEYLGWEVIVIWRVNKTSDVLECLEITQISGLQISEFIEASKHLVFTAGEMFPGYVWETFRPVWFKNISEEPKFSRGKISNVIFQGAMGFPFFENGNVAGVIELFKRTPLIEDIDQAKLNMLSTIGLTFGHFLQRLESESMIQQLASIVTYSTEGIYSVDVNGIVKNWNMGMERMFGWKASEIVGKHVTVLYPDETYHEFDDLKKIILSGKSIEHTQTQRLRKDRSLIWVEITAAPIFDTHNNVVGGSIVVQDISQEHKMLSAIKKSEGKFRSFVETTEEWIWEMDKDAVFTYSNPSVKKILGIDSKELIGKQLYYFIPIQERDKVKEDIESCKQHKTGWSKRILTFIHKNGSEHTLEGNAQPVFDEKEELIGYRGADRDITEQKNMEKLKNEFISIISHELRTPLTSIHGALGLLVNDPSLPSRPKNLLEIAYRNSVRLTRMINEILSVENLEMGLEMSIGPVVIADVVKEAVASSKMVADKIQVVLKTFITDQSLMVLGNYERLIQVLLNLISNAIKFSKPHDEITISIESLDHIVRVSVQDQGPGIPEEFQTKIFGKFAQADSSDARTIGGAGLGLNICKSIIEKMGGRIDFITKKNQGTKFFFDLPRSP